MYLALSDDGWDIGKTADVIKGYGWHARLAGFKVADLGPVLSSYASPGPRANDVSRA